MVSAAEPRTEIDSLVDSTLDSAGKDGLTHAVFNLPLEEDSGSDTLGRYRYQAEVAARDCLAMLTQKTIDFIVCEWHEDFVVALTDGSVELVSVKHREDDQGPWTITELCKTGGLAHLFDRWCACESAPNIRLRLATNAAMSPAKGNAAALARMCGPDPELTIGLADMVKKVARQMLKVRWKQSYPNIPETPEVRKLDDIQLPPGFADKVTLFLAVLEISSDPPQRRYITYVNVQSLLAPAVKSLELMHVDLEATYEAIVDRIERANRDEENRGQLAVHIADPARVRYNTQLQQRISRRLLTRTIIYEEFVYTTVQPPTVPRGQAPVAAPGGAKLRRKLSRGQVPSDEAEFAESLRSAWFTTWSGRRSGLAGDEADLTNLSFDVLDTAFKCRKHARAKINDGSAYGAQMNELIIEHLTVDALTSLPPFPLNDLHLRGLAYQLCDDCRFYFSEPFDTDEEPS